MNGEWNPSHSPYQWLNTSFWFTGNHWKQHSKLETMSFKNCIVYPLNALTSYRLRQKQKRPRKKTKHTTDFTKELWTKVGDFSAVLNPFHSIRFFVFVAIIGVHFSIFNPSSVLVLLWYSCWVTVQQNFHILFQISGQQNRKHRESVTTSACGKCV